MPPSRTESDSSPAARVRKNVDKVYAACTNCKRKKVKCSGEYPCQYCAKRSLVCSFQVSEQQRLFSAARIQELEARLTFYEPQNALDESSLSSPAAFRGTSATSPLQQPTPQHEVLSTQGITAEREIGSSQDFGNRVQSLFEKRPSQLSENHPSSKSTREALFPEKTPSISLRGTEGNQSLQNILPISEDEGFDLLDAVMLYFYEPQHLFDARATSDRISGLYEDIEGQSQSSTIWTIHTLLVFAVGRLLKGISEVAGQPPGRTLFRFVEQNLPSPSDLRRQGLAGIEVLALMVVYLQNIDQKHDASIYAGLAFRLSIMHGIHRKHTTQGLRRSEAANTNRLWWTVQMLERRIMIATGCPLILDDTFVDALFPNDSPGFPSALSIQINIHISQIQGRVYSVIYSTESRPKDLFLADVQDIISSLTRLAHQISHSSSLGASVLGHKTSKREQRTSISLYTVLYTTIMLTLRPIMLHLTRSMLNGEVTFAQTPKDFQQLLWTCIEAARRSLELLLVAQREDMIAKFGFFDLDTMFSAGFIMLLAAIIESTISNHDRHAVYLRPSPGIEEAIQLLDYLGTFNNQAAIQRRDQIQKLYDRIPSLTNQYRSSGGGSFSTTADDTSQNIPAPVYSAGINPDSQSAQVGEYGPVEGWAAGSLPIEFPDDPHVIYSLYHDNEFTLTGGDMADFDELQRHLFGNNQ